jgi:hypothetical protein
MSVQIKGMAALAQSFENLKDASAEAISKALVEDADTLLNMATPITPKDTGRLRRSARIIAPAKNASKRIVARIRWGGAKAPYAAWVHEMPENLNWTTPGTGPKYAERAANMLVASLPQKVADFLSVGLKKRFPATRSRAKVTITAQIGK